MLKMNCVLKFLVFWDLNTYIFVRTICLDFADVLRQFVFHLTAKKSCKYIMIYSQICKTIFIIVYDVFRISRRSKRINFTISSYRSWKKTATMVYSPRSRELRLCPKTIANEWMDVQYSTERSSQYPYIHTYNIQCYYIHTVLCVQCKKYLYT